MKREASKAGKVPSGEAFPRILLGSALVAVVLLLALLSTRQVASPDVGFHLKAGEHILSGHGWPRADPFTFTVRDHDYVDTSWGYQVVLALVHRAAGAQGLVLFHALLVLGLFGVLFLTIRLAPAEPAMLLILLLLGVLAAEMRFEVRPELVSYLLLSAVLYLLHRHSEGKVSPLWALVPIHWLWANLHGGLIALGWGALGCFVVGLAIRDRRLDRRLLLWSGLSVAIALVNPYGLRGVLFPLTLLTRLQPENVFAQSIGEFTSPFALRLSERFPFYPRVPLFAFRAFALLSVLAWVAAFKKKRFWCILLGLAFLALSSRMIRNMPLLVVACLPATAWGLALASPDGRAARRGNCTPWLAKTAAALVGTVALILALRVIHDAYYLASRRTDRFGWSWNRDALPIDAADYARRAQLRGPVLNHLNFGGWLMWSLPDPVFIDGRLEVMGEKFFEEYRRVLASPEALEAACARYGIRWIVFPYAFNPDLLGRLSRDARWELAYADGLASIFVRKESPARASLPERLPGVSSLAALPGIGARPRAGGMARWLDGCVRRQAFPFEDYNLGLFFLYRGEAEQAAARFARAASASGGRYYETYNNLGAALYRMNRLDEARACYRIVLQDDPRNRVARERAGS